MPNTKVVGIIFPYILTPIPNLYDHSFPRYGQITFLTFRRPTTLTFDLKFWKYLSVTVYPYVICMPSFIMIGWEMAEILHFEILRKHGQTHTQTDRQTDMGITIPRPPPMGGEVKIGKSGEKWHKVWKSSEKLEKVAKNGEKWGKSGEKVVKSGEKLEKMGKSVEKGGEKWHKVWKSREKL